MCPMNIVLMSFFGSSLGQRLSASWTAWVKISLASKPSCLANLDIPAVIMLTSGFPFNPFCLSISYTFMASHNKNYSIKSGEGLALLSDFFA